MKFELEKLLSQLPIFEKIAALQQEIAAHRPISPEKEHRIMQKLRLDWNYHSNAIEGNTLTYGETAVLLREGLTAKGKPLKDHEDIKGHNQAIDYLLDFLKDEDRNLTESQIREIHVLILGREPFKSPAKTPTGEPTYKWIQAGEYKKLPNHVETRTGAIHYYALPEEVPAKMQELLEWFKAAQAEKIHPIVVAAILHYRFVSIHPFDDGNGRLSRWLMNLVLMKAGYPITVIKNDKKSEYYAALVTADEYDDLTPFVNLIADYVYTAQTLWLKGANGESMNDPDDLDKKLALLKIELESVGKKIAVERSEESIKEVIQKSVNQFFKKQCEEAQKYSPFYSKIYCEVEYANDKQQAIIFPENNLENNIENINLLRMAIKLNIFNNLKFKFVFRDFNKVSSSYPNYESFYSNYQFYFDNNYYLFQIENVNDGKVTKFYDEFISDEEIKQITNMENNRHTIFIERKIAEFKQSKNR